MPRHKVKRKRVVRDAATVPYPEGMRFDPGPFESSSLAEELLMCGCANLLDAQAPLDRVRALDPTARCERCGGVTR